VDGQLASVQALFLSLKNHACMLVLMIGSAIMSGSAILRWFGC